VALVGGGSNPQPGEISLAHNGVLFLDELPEFRRQVLEVLRQPMEERRVTVSRAKMTVDYPASFMLIAAMNPCPCGYYNHPTVECTCPPGAVKKYLNKVSGPLMDRIDLHIEVTPVPVSQLNNLKQGESSAAIRERVIAARAIQTARFAGHPGVHCNAQMTSKLTREHCQLDDQCRTIIETAMNRLGLSARAYDRILRVSRTIADLEGSPAIQPHHLQEAITYRSLDRDSWGK
jgi:magnesium chelatase family protein